MIVPVRRRLPAAILTLTLVLPLLLVLAGPTAAGGRPEPVRFATFNASLNRNAPGQALADLSSPGNPQASAVAEIIQRTRPEVLLVNEFDYIDPPEDDPDGNPFNGNAMTDAFQLNYLSQPQADGLDGIAYPYVFVAPSNTGVPNEGDFDFNNNGVLGEPDDAYGFGFFPGQFGMAVFSQHPIDYAAARTFQEFKWADMPGALLPDDPATPEADADWYSADELAIFRLSSKSHWDVPIAVRGTTVHFLVSHPTPPVFDGPEDRNGTRNHDEIRLWADYITRGAGGYIYDDAGATGGLKPGEKFVVAGDQNSDPLDGDSIPGSIQQLLDSPRVNTTVTPASGGGPFWAEEQDEINDHHLGDPAFDTADFCDFEPVAEPPFPPCTGPGNLRADYVLPSRNMRIVDAGIFWPIPGETGFELVGTGFPVPSSDHRLVWVDLMVPGSARGS